jgi:hypothetical protein
LTEDNADVRINGIPDDRNDTGLYELYKNVVERFNNSMVKEAERYAGTRHEADEDLPTDNWRSRNNYGAVGCASATPACAGEHGPGMSYCFGCKDTVPEFDVTAADCQAEDTADINKRENDGIANNEYRGNIGDDCGVGSGGYDWAGLKSGEHGTAFNISYWAGIDCSGLVWRAGDAAKYTLQGMINVSSLARDSCRFFYDNTTCENHRRQNNPVPLHITYTPSGLTYNFGDEDGRTNEALKKIHKGDWVSYQHHISIVHSDRARSCVTNDDGHTTCTYEIVHASGSDELCYKAENSKTKDCYFNRKVTVNSINKELQSKTLKNPTGFGRTKLWD